jgi:transcriptional regulator with XRE-family HTH domain
MTLRIEEILELKGVTIAELARRLNVSRSSMHNTIKKGNPNLSTLQDIASAIGVPITELFTDGSVEELNGFVEYKGEVHKIRSIADLKELIVKAGGELEELPTIPDHENIRGKEYYK